MYRMRPLAKTLKEQCIAPSETSDAGTAMRRSRSVSLLVGDGAAFLPFVSSQRYDAHFEPSHVTHIVLVAERIRNLVLVIVSQIGVVRRRLLAW